MSREGYSWGQVNPRDLAEVLVYPGFYRYSVQCTP